MCNLCLSTSEISGASDTSSMENVEARYEETYSNFHNKKNHVREGGGGGGGAGQVKIRISLP